MKVTVLYGGPSAEREISLVSGQAVIEGLRSMGHDVYGSDVSPGDLSGLDRPCDVLFPVLHGAFGESGELQQILEQRHIPFVGSSSKASKLGIDKVATKKAWTKAGLPTPKSVVLQRGMRNDKWQSLGLPVVVKAVDSGSSIDVYICKTESEAAQAIDSLFQRHAYALIEKFINGPELTIGLLEEKPLAPIRIVVQREFFDFDAKYKGCGTEHRFDTGMSELVLKNCQELARKANKVVGARDLARIDIMLDEQDQPYLLEINTIPGFTPRSLLPEAAAHVGIDFAHLVDRLVKRAAMRGATIKATEVAA